MAKTNLNVSPYFDDFDATKNFYKVLFKPGYPVQARELTTLQSILQDQISSLGKSIFKDGSVVIPGEVSYDPNYYAVKINPIHLGLDVEFYYKELIGKRLFGDISQITAVVQNVVSRNNSIENVTTLYVKYLNSNSNNENLSFIDGETLTKNPLTPRQLLGSIWSSLTQNPFAILPANPDVSNISYACSRRRTSSPVINTKSSF